jgi:hypothetical protein
MQEIKINIIDGIYIMLITAFVFWYFWGSSC